MPRRSRAREVALQALYQIDLVMAAEAADFRRFVSGRLKVPALIDFCLALVEGVQRHRAEIDAALESRAEHWRLSRMTVVDRTILRIGCHEILHTQTPPAVAADEAVELARRYGAESSPRFVAGILGRLIADRAQAEA